MSKILYDFDNIEIVMDKFIKVSGEFGILRNNVNALSINVDELKNSLSNAKKLTIETLVDIYDILSTHSRKVKELCDAYKTYENKQVSQNSLLNKDYTCDNVVSGNTYKIKRGDTLLEIARDNNTTVDKIVEANEQIKDKDLIYAGESIVIPGVSSNFKEKNIVEKHDTVETKKPNNNKTVTNGNPTKNGNEDKNITKEQVPLKDAQNNSESTTNTSKIVSANLSKYHENKDLGFVLTTDNKKYDITDENYDLLCAIVAAESDKTVDDALAVTSVILNRCESPRWVGSHGSDPIKQATARGQFVVYETNEHKKFLNGKAPDSVKIAVKDAINGVRNCKYLNFRANYVTNYSNNQISSTGNRYKNVM